MKRLIDHFLLEWQQKKNHKPLLLRGARQVGKTHAVRVLGQTFTNFIEINLESNLAARKILEQDLDLARITLQLSELLQQPITPGQTLLFFDEIQNVPQAITALRYFYEQLPELHVIAAGSLLDFAIEQVGIPVGRVSTLYMYPLSFLEFAVATGHATWAKAILDYNPQYMSLPLHEKILALLGTYLAIGGLPEAVNEWVHSQTSRAVKTVHSDLIYTYEQDFGKYAKQHQIKYLNLIFLRATEQLANKFMFTKFGEYKKRELAPALELLEKAGLLYKVMHSAAQGIPIGAQADPDKFKLIFLDVGLSQALLKLDISSWLIDPTTNFINKGELVEAFIGQELLAYADPISKESLFYWARETSSSSAEIDYVIQLQDQVVPVEVKSGTSHRIKSMQIFLETHPNSTQALRFWANPGTPALDTPEATMSPLKSYPLYAVAHVLSAHQDYLRPALEYLVAL
ncbi:MAG TPA: AAA family ATPase [Candidatus Babeliales bacterium]|nr:AAA family ATPase [Candidatus Babeliales bacterium]